MRRFPAWLRRPVLRVGLLSTLLYAGLWWLVDVAFLAHWFPVPFLTGADFYRRYSTTVGGSIQYLSQLFCQTYARPWAGVLALTGLGLATWAVTRGILRRFSPGSWSGPAAALSILVLTLAARSMSVVFILPMLAGLAPAWLYTSLVERWADRRAQAIVFAAFLLASLPLYWMAASGFLYLAVVGGLFEGLVRRRPLRAAAWVVAGVAVPQVVNLVYYEPDAIERYLRWMTIPDRGPVAAVMAVAMYLFVPVAAIAAFLVGALRVADRVTPRVGRAARVAGFAALVLLASRLVILRPETTGWTYADYLQATGRTDEALSILARSPDDSDPARFLTIFALARSGRLPWEMFRYPQRASSDALLMRDAMWDTNPAVAAWRSDLYLELGRVNDSQRWAHEGLAIEGETPRVLERMAVTYVLGGKPGAARSFLHALERVPFQEERARRRLVALDHDPTMQADALVARIRPLMLQKDYVGSWTTEQVLQQCLDANPSNRLAFEYLLAHVLLTSDMNGLARLAPRFKDFYRVLPTHVQEAALGYWNLNGSLPPGVDGSAISQEMALRFKTFFRIYAQYEKVGPEAAWKALAPEYGATWWFFYLFNRTAAGPVPDSVSAPAK